MKEGTRIRVKNYSVELNGMNGTITAVHGKTYDINLDNMKAIFIGLDNDNLSELNKTTSNSLAKVRER